MFSRRAVHRKAGALKVLKTDNRRQIETQTMAAQKHTDWFPADAT